MPRPKKIPQILTEEEFNRALKVYYKNKPSFTRLRNCLIFSICFYIGLRPKEAKNIKLCHLNLIESQIYIPAENNKQRNQDIMPLQPFLIEKIKSYLLLRNKLYDSEWLFPSKRDKELERGCLIRAFDIMAKLAGLRQISYIDGQGNKRRNLSIYSLRHSFATYVQYKFKDNKITAKALRHYDPQCRSTFIYNHTDAFISRKEIVNDVWSQ